MTQSFAKTLYDIQRLQFRDRPQAEALLLQFLRSELPELSSVVIHTKPESLNSINGFLTIGDREYFFKTHTEEHENDPGRSTNTELYNSQLLEKAGYPVISPKLARHIPGRQIAVYEKVDMTTLFDYAKEVEDRQLAGEPTPQAELLVGAQEQLDKTTFQVYLKTIGDEPLATPHAPIHNLFSRRLEPGKRIDDFYAGRTLHLPSGEIAFGDLCQLRWNVNGVDYAETLGDIITEARKRLNPLLRTLTVCGHGDAHNGNVWLDKTSYRLWYFDPAFAGHHSPLLDLVKPLFHNVFARWMYHPAEVDSMFEVMGVIRGNQLHVEHNYRVSALRLSFFESKVRHVLTPLLSVVRERGALGPEWLKDLKMALFCCPFLTVNLAAPAEPHGKLESRYSPKIKLLGLAMAVEMGAQALRGTNEVLSTLESLRDAGPVL